MKNYGYKKHLWGIFLQILFPAFFLLHGYNENYGLIPANVLQSLFLKYVSVSLVLFVVNLVLLKDVLKSILITLFLLCLFFFFGAFHDLVKKILHPGFFTSYKLLLPLVLVFAGFVFVQK